MDREASDKGSINNPFADYSASIQGEVKNYVGSGNV